MRKSLKKIAVLAMTGIIAAGSVISASAASVGTGQWLKGISQESWWFPISADYQTYASNGWYWIKDADGTISRYYFDANGWMAAGTTVDGQTVDESGRLVVNGVVQKGTEDDSYLSQGVLVAPTELTAATTSFTSTVNVSKAKNSAKKAYKAKSSAGDSESPVNAVFAKPYENSALSGNTVSNAWANFTMTLPKAPEIDDAGSGTDWFMDGDDASLICSYYALDRYAAGNTSLDAFVSSFLADGRGFKGGALEGDVQLGAYSFKKLTKAEQTPTGDTYDTAYLRVVEGTNMVQILQVDQFGSGVGYEDVLNTIARLQ